MNKLHFDELSSIFAKLRTSDEARMLLKDVLTPRELDSVVERWQIAKLLAKGVPQRKISERLKVSISKVTRGSQAFKGGHGGFRKFLRNI